MKKIVLALLVVSAIGVTSCKKDSETAPEKSDKVLKLNGDEEEGLDKTNVGSWD